MTPTVEDGEGKPMTLRYLAGAAAQSMIVTTYVGFCVAAAIVVNVPAMALRFIRRGSQ